MLLVIFLLLGTSVGDQRCVVLGTVQTQAKDMAPACCLGPDPESMAGCTHAGVGPGEWRHLTLAIT